MVKDENEKDLNGDHEKSSPDALERGTARACSVTDLSCTERLNLLYYLIVCP